ncbi:hypothetical protein BDN70DRAFT_883058 [Pholiota conissans]|uniref:Uncharacterized protein n=1 Tax=Pholiota conissans TaxID=109636 RepID=A0A9P5YWP9_9AGAR|nr:hypothetical protein BDN70DRAFT_883058 [Pholiota conissans]
MSLSANSSSIPPACQSDGIGGYLQEMLYLIVANTILWCMVVAIATKTFYSALNAKTIYTPRMRRILVVFVIIMTLISTASLALTLHYAHRLFFSPSQGGLNAHRRLETIVSASAFITLPFAIFGADAFMVWRCWILYQGVHRVVKFTLFCILILLLFVSLATAVWMYMPLITIQILVLPTLGATLIVNILLSVLIITRLLNHERWMRKATGVRQRSSPFRNVIMICVESCALIIACALFGLGTTWRDSSLHLLAVPLTFLPHISAISAFLIILRVANGRAPSITNLASPTLGDSTGPNNRSQELPSLQFARPTSAISAQQHSPVNSDVTHLGSGELDSLGKAV